MTLASTPARRNALFRITTALVTAGTVAATIPTLVVAGGGSGGPPVRHVRFPYGWGVVKSASMEPAMHCADRADTGCRGVRPDSYLEMMSGARGVRRGDIVALRLPDAAARYCARGPVVADKRVIALAGERVVERHGVIWVNGRRLKEPYVPRSEREDHSGSWRVPQGSLFVAGDNRKVSCDSRYWGPVLRSQVVGQVVEIIRPESGGRNPVGPPIVHVTYPYQARGGSTAAMEPAIHCARPARGCLGLYGDLVLIELSRARNLHRGDIITFLLPRAAKRFCGTGVAMERIIGLPGETVREMDGIISIQGRRLPEPYVPARERDHLSGVWHVPTGAYFVMADYRSYSCDSRYWGSVKASRIQGRAVEIIRQIGGKK